MADAPVAGADRLAFVEEPVAGQDGYVVDVGRSTTTRLTRGLAEVEGPVWSPAGTRLAFAASRRVETIDPDGRNRRRVSQRSGNYWALASSPPPRP